MQRKLPRGISQNNPGNLRKTNDKWQGLADYQPDPEFFTFKSPVYGIRAMARTLIAYQDKHGLRTLNGIIRRWAPPSENDVLSYIDSVAMHTGFGPSDALDMHDPHYLKPLLRAIIKHENGYDPYTDAQVDKALVLAGVEPAEKPLSQSRTIQGSQALALTGVASTAVGVAQAIEPALPVLEWVRDNLTTALIAVGVAVLVFTGWVVWARIDDRMKGLR